MFKFIVVLAFVAAASAVGNVKFGPASYAVPKNTYSSNDDAHAETKTLDSDVRADGFNYVVETTNHIRADAAGDEHGNIHGGFEWISPEGEHVLVKYVADENGYQPSSDLLPTPPPTPVAILKALEYIRSHPQKEVVYSGKHY